MRHRGPGGRRRTRRRRALALCVTAAALAVAGGLAVVHPGGSSSSARPGSPGAQSRPRPEPGAVPAPSSGPTTRSAVPSPPGPPATTGPSRPPVPRGGRPQDGGAADVGREATGTPLGAYTGSAADGVAGHAALEEWVGAPLPYALDFAAAAGGWSGLVSHQPVFRAWRDSRARLVYSLQMFPDEVARAVGGGEALRRCAAGWYDAQWALLGRNLVANGLEDAVVRPGWEMNNTWFGWSAVGHPERYRGCFRRIVTTMRGVAGERFTFTWNPSIGPGAMPAELAWPGASYVDQVGVDLYDWSWAKGRYDTAARQSAEQRAAAVRAAWADKVDGDHGLRFWADFARRHGATLAFPEWGLARRFEDGFGGGDNPYFVERMIDFIYDPRNNVEYACYFNTRSPDADHRLTGSPAPFPRSSEAFRRAVATVPAAFHAPPDDGVVVS